ncbi:MAG: hypothetical protein R2838_21220 [Caldilineaceae bacterium]
MPRPSSGDHGGVRFLSSRDEAGMGGGMSSSWPPVPDDGPAASDQDIPF